MQTKYLYVHPPPPIPPPPHPHIRKLLCSKMYLVFGCGKLSYSRSVEDYISSLSATNSCL